MNTYKIKNDKYYTNNKLAEYCFNKANEIFGENIIDSYIEPSAGNGVFINFFDKEYLAIDIEPEDTRIIKCDYFDIHKPYSNRCLIIGNPPFGNKGDLALKFLKHSIKFADYIAFILPALYYNNTYTFYEYDLIHSELLINENFSNRKITCCFNCYKAPMSKLGIKCLNTKNHYELNDIEFHEFRRTNNKIIDYDYDICINTFGRSIGKITNVPGKWVKEMHIKIINQALKDEIVNNIKSINWFDEYYFSGVMNLTKWQIIKTLKRRIPSLK